LTLVVALYAVLIAPATNAASPFQANGQLVSTGDVVINSNRVANGATVLPNSRITVPTGSQATINLGNLGKVDVQPCSDFALDFSGSSVNVTLTYGTVTLDLAAGITGEVRMVGTARVRVTQGQVSVRTDDPQPRTVSSGGSRRTRNATVTTAGTAANTFSVEGTGQFACKGGQPPATVGGVIGTTTAGGATATAAAAPLGLTMAIVLGSVAAGVGTAIALGDEPEALSGL
jgi:hypothetical protein